jgi:hypothetical protein
MNALQFKKIKKQYTMTFKIKMTFFFKQKNNLIPSGKKWMNH